MNLKTTYIAIAIYIGFVVIAVNNYTTEETARSILMGALFIGGLIGGFIDGKAGIKGVGISTAFIVVIYIAYSFIETKDPFFLIGLIMLLIFQFIYLAGWGIGYKALK